jgi:hypothetical protein
LELRRAVVAKVVAHFYMYIYMSAFVMFFVLKRERERAGLQKVKP